MFKDYASEITDFLLFVQYFGEAYMQNFDRPIPREIPREIPKNMAKKKWQKKRPKKRLVRNLPTHRMHPLPKVY